MLVFPVPLIPTSYANIVQLTAEQHTRLTHVRKSVTGSQERTALWMAHRRTSLGGETAFHALSRGDDELVWDTVAFSDFDVRASGMDRRSAPYDRSRAQKSRSDAQTNSVVKRPRGDDTGSITYLHVAFAICRVLV
ncbi:hypothetical protein AXG89_28175 (plasmid) [Burkholderia sp. PAMC 26561]|nr:hypothetical protein AXG89_24515 [Burkholderia sp. PAMC 26561]AME27751.2 hypothetical protein AXG89_28175 [Burkholderia sp. PAMC 26561]